MTERVAVKPAAEFEDGSRALVEVDGVEVGVLKVDGEFYALRNECAHQGGPVCKGEVTNRLVADPPESGELTKGEFDGAKTIACPWHGYTYDLATGEHIGVADIQLRTYDVVVEDGTVYVEA